MGAGLSLRAVVQRRGGREVLRVEALDLSGGERLAVLGPNGAGKTTLLRLMAAVDVPHRGQVVVDGVSTDLGGVDLRRRIAYATQRPALLTTSVRRNVELPLRWRKVPRPERRRRALQVLRRLGVEHLCERPAQTLSGGEMQRVSLARALVTEPDLLLLDEPAAGLDAESRAAFFADLEHVLADRATTVVQVSHRVEEALRLADRVVVLVDGSIRQIGGAEVITRQPADAAVAALVGYENLVDAHRRPDGGVLLGRMDTGLFSNGPAGPATLAVFAVGLRLSPNGSGLRARVRGVTAGPGHWVVTLDGGVRLRAHVPLDCDVPAAGDDVTVAFDPALSAVLPRAPRRSTTGTGHAVAAAVPAPLVVTPPSPGSTDAS